MTPSRPAETGATPDSSPARGNEVVAALWLAFVLAGFALALFFDGGLSLGVSVDLLLPLYVLMIAWTVLQWLRPVGPNGERESGGNAGTGGSAHAG